MKRICLLFVALLVLLTAASAQYNFTNVECPGMHVIYVSAINGNGATLLAGYNTDADPTWHTLIIKNGKCTPLGPGTPISTSFSMGYGMNERGDVVGNYSGGSYGTASHGYLLQKNGVFTTLDFPTADSTVAMGIDASGMVIGQWAVVDAQGNAVFTHGFTWKNGVFTDVAIPGAPLTVLNGINAQGEYTGWQAPDMLYWVMHGFVYSHGQYTGFDVPGAVGTQITGINDRGHIAGQYWGDDGMAHGFVKIGPELRLIDVPGSIMTQVLTLNNAGELVGWYYNPDGTFHGYTGGVALLAYNTGLWSSVILFVPLSVWVIYACAIRGPYSGKVVGVAFVAGALTHVLLFIGYGFFKSGFIGSAGLLVYAVVIGFTPIILATLGSRFFKLELLRPVPVQ